MEEALIYRERRGTNSSKWNQLHRKFSRDDLMGLWVADMDFAVAACVREALQKYVDFGVFGYDLTPESYYDAFIQWEQTYHGYTVQREWLRYSPGVVAAFNWFVQLLTKPGDGVLIQTPVYYPFMSAALDNGCRLVKSELVNDQGIYTIDFEDFERKLKEERVKVFLLCSPHNPVGRVWKREELQRMLSLCRTYGVYVVADEIHHDFVYEGHHHIPTATIGDYDDMLVTITAPSKTFNLAGLKNSVVIIPDEKMRKSYDDYAGRLHIASGNSFGVIAAEAAYRGGRPWLESLLKTLKGNYDLLAQRLPEENPGVVVSPLEGTYLAWVDLSRYVKPEDMTAFVEGACGLAVDYGSWFGGNAPCHIRLNLATCPENIRHVADVLHANLQGRLS